MRTAERCGRPPGRSSPTQAEKGAPLSVQTEATDQRQAAVYRLYDADGGLLYIGSSCNPVRRYRDHYSKPWWPLVARRVEEWHPTQTDAYAAEMKAIAAEGPAHNHMGTPRYVPPSQKAAARRAGIQGELSVKGIMAKHGISRQSLHTYRQRPDFPAPVSRPGTGGLRWRETDVAAWFATNPPSRGKRTDLARDEGDSMWSTSEERTPSASVSPEDQERLQEAIRQHATREAQAIGLPVRLAQDIGSASIEGVRGLIEHWRQA